MIEDIPIPTGFIEFSEQQLSEFAENEYLIIDDFLPQELASNLLKELKFWQKENKFKQAGIGKASTLTISEDIRKDVIKWINPEACLPQTKSYLNALDNLTKHLNQNFFLSLKDKEAMYAIYEKGAFYKAHRDRFKGQAHRLISVVLYLNKNWKKKDGGQLIIYKETPIKKETIVEPFFNRLILFKSEILHEVMPCTKMRYSITTWLKDQYNEVSFL